MDPAAAQLAGAAAVAALDDEALGVVVPFEVAHRQREGRQETCLAWPAGGEIVDEPPLTTTGTRGDRDTDSPVSRDEEPGEKRFSDRQSLASRPSRPSRAVRRRAIAIAPA